MFRGRGIVKDAPIPPEQPHGPRKEEMAETVTLKDLWGAILLGHEAATRAGESQRR